LELLAQELAHHRLAGRHGPCLQIIQRRGGRQLVRIDSGQVDPMQLGHPIRLILVVNATDQDA
jgi:hypothetical protein